MTSNPLTLADLLASQSEEIGEKPFLDFEDRIISFEEMNKQVNRAANGLARLGLQRGVGASIMMSNSPEWLFVYFAIQKLNAYAVPVNTGQKGEGLKHILDHSDSTLLIVDEIFLPEIEPLLDSLPKLSTMVVNRQSDAALPDGFLSLEDLMDTSHEDPGVEIRDGEMSAILYTSGTTGAPKGVVSRYQSTGYAGLKMFGAALKDTDVMYTCLPLFHANALSLTTMRALATGTPMVLSRRFSASRFWDEIRHYGVTTFNALGAMIPILMKQPERDNDADNPVHTVFSAACPPSVWEAFEKRFNVRIIEGYAAVDGGGFSVLNFGDSPKGSVGKPGNPYRLIDDDGNDVPVGTSGELIFKVDDERLRKVEYYKNEEAANARIKNGWFYTGDMLHADEDGNLYFDDRKTDSLRRRGENISAWEVERELNKHEAVLESAVFGVPSDLGEDEVMAAIVLKPGVTASHEEILAHCEKHLAKYMVPRYFEFREELPKTGTHRTQKTVLKQQGVGPDTWDKDAHAQ